MRAVYRYLGLGDFADEWAAQAVDAAGSKDVPAADLILGRGVAHVDPGKKPHCFRRPRR